MLSHILAGIMMGKWHPRRLCLLLCIWRTLWARKEFTNLSAIFPRIAVCSCFIFLLFLILPL